MIQEGLPEEVASEDEEERVMATPGESAFQAGPQRVQRLGGNLLGAFKEQQEGWSAGHSEWGWEGRRRGN